MIWPIAQLGFLRISLVLPDYAADFASVRAVLTRITEHSGHKFFPCDKDFSVLPGSLPGHQQITNQYLAALAAPQNAKLATLERSSFGKAVCLIPAK